MEVDGHLLHSGEGLVRFIYLLLVTSAIILGNVLVIVAVGKFKKLRRSTNIMLASLAVADLMVGILTVPLYIAWTMHPRIFDHSSFLCHSVLLSCLLVVAASQINLLFLSFERYLAVCAPFRHRDIMICCPWLHRAIICLTWIVSLAATGLSSLAMRSDYDMCNYYKVFDKWFLFFAVIFGIFIPFIAIIFINLKVFLVVRQHEIRRIYFGFENSDSNKNKSECSEQELIRPLQSQRQQSEAYSRNSTEEKWTTLCFFLCRNQCFYRESIEAGDSDVFMDTSEDAVTKPGQHSASPFLKLDQRRADGDAYEDDIDGHPPFPDVTHNPSRQGQERGSLSPHLSRRDLVDPILQATPTSGCKQTPATRKSVKAPKLEVFFDRGRWRCVHTDPFVLTKKHGYEPLSTIDFERNLSPLDQMFVIKSSLDLASCRHTNSPSLPLNRNAYKVSPVKSSPGKRQRVLVSPTKESPRKGIAYSLSKMTSSLPLVNIHSTIDNHTPEYLYSKLQPVEKKIKKKYKQRGIHDFEKELLLKYDLNDIFMSPRKQNIQETVSLQNLGVMSLDDQVIAHVSNTQRKQVSVESGVSDDFREYSVSMDIKTSGAVENSLFNLCPSNVTTTLQPQTCVARYHNLSTFSTKLRTRTISRAEFPDKIPKFPTTLRETDQRQPQFLSTHSITDRPLEWTCNPLGLERRWSTPAILQSVAEVKPEGVEVVRKWKPRRQSEPPQRGNERSDTHLSIFAPHRRNGAGSTPPRLSSRDRGSLAQRPYVSKKVARTVALVCASFILAWLPFFTVIIVNTFCTECNLAYFLNAVLMVAFAQSAINPIIYALCHASFRNAYKSLFSQMCSKS